MAGDDEEAARLLSWASGVVRDSGQTAGRKLAAASLLMANGLLDAACDAYRRVAAAHLEVRAECELNLGAICMFERRFDEALKFYRSAGLHGADPAEVAALIAEAETARDAAN